MTTNKEMNENSNLSRLYTENVDIEPSTELAGATPAKQKSSRVLQEISNTNAIPVVETAPSHASSSKKCPLPFTTSNSSIVFKKANEEAYPVEISKIPIDMLQLIPRKEKEINVKVCKIICEYENSDTVEYSRFSREERESRVRTEQPSWAIYPLPQPVCDIYKDRGLDQTWLIKELGKSPSFCKFLVECFLNDGKIPVGFSSLVDRFGLEEADVIIAGDGGFVPSKVEDICENVSMTVCRRIFLSLGKLLGLKIFILNFDRLQLTFGKALGTELKAAGVTKHPLIKKMIHETLAFEKSCRQGLDSEILDVIKKYRNPEVPILVAEYFSEATLKNFEVDNADNVPTLIESFKETFDIGHEDCFQFSHWAHLYKAMNDEGGVSSKVLEATKNSLEKLCTRIGKPNVDIPKFLQQIGIQGKSEKISKKPYITRTDYRVFVCRKGDREQIKSIHDDHKFESMCYTEFEMMVEDDCLTHKLPEGQVLGDFLRECIQKGRVIGDWHNGIYASKREHDLKKIILMKCHGQTQCKYVDPTTKSRCEAFALLGCYFCKNHSQFEGWIQCKYVDPTTKSRCEAFGLFESYLCDNHSQFERHVYFAYSLANVEEGDGNIQSKSLTDMATFLKQKFSKQFGSMTTQEIRSRIMDRICTKNRVFINGPFVAYESNTLMDILRREAEKIAKKVTNVYFEAEKIAKKVTNVYFAYFIPNVEEGNGNIQSKSLMDMVTFLKQKFSKQFGSMTTQEIRSRIMDRISSKSRVCRHGPFVACESDTLMDILRREAENEAEKEAKKVTNVYFAYFIPNVEEGNGDIQSKSLTDMVTFLKQKFSKQFGSMTTQEIRSRIIDRISSKSRVCRHGPFVAYESDKLMDILRREAEKEAKKKKNKKKNKNKAKGNK